MDIVVCDDEPLARDRLERMLTHLAHRVLGQAKNGVEALELVEQEQPDVILLDIRMPEMNGLECAQKLSSLDTPPAIASCTAYDQYAIDAFKTNAMA